MDWKKNAIKAAKSAGMVILGALALTLLGAPFQESLDAFAGSLAASIPMLGAFVAPAIKVLLLSGATALATSLENARKHLGDPPAALPEPPK